ncbi:MAG: cryptochrome/photolyase family protein [Saprospiraceae bacterium]
MSITLRLILGDQLNLFHPWFRETGQGVVYAMMECRSETDYVRHHIQKVAGFFAAMRGFAGELRAGGFRVEYLKLDDPDNLQSVHENLRAMARRLGAGRVEYQLPEEYRLDVALSRLQEEMPIPVVGVDSAHFLSGRSDLEVFFKGKKTFVMESFYRSMRVKTGLLMEADGKTPEGGRWNFDAENRKRLPDGVALPPVLNFAHDVRDIVEMLSRSGVATIGSIDPQNFSWPVSRADALVLLAHFIGHRLPFFGRYQDALSERDEVLFHSKLSFALNTKMLSPLEVVKAAVDYYAEAPGPERLAQVEGFVRQIIGWREYMRGVYWAKMPEYAHLNYFGHTAPLPSWFWTGNTRMRCLQKAIQQSLGTAYAHHIQRLMVTGNFALLLGVSPAELDAWYLGIYMDALEWVEITNTRGMSQYADGGIVGTKPYVSSANYIRNMGDHCRQCPYDPDKRYGEGACPFNSLYWDFYARHAEKLSRNPRIGMAYTTLAKMAATERERILEQAAAYKADAENL